MELLLGLDVGTTAAKALAFDRQGRVVACASQGYGLSTPQEGWVEQDPEILWQTAVAVLRQAASQIQPGDRILGMSLSSQGGTTIVVDAAGRPLYPAISWMDQRARQECELVRREFGAEALYRLTGWPLLPGLPLLHILWLRRNRPEIFRAAARFLFVNDFIGLRLTGELCMNPSDASITQLLDIAHCAWDERLLALAGVKVEQLTPILPSGMVFGQLTRSAGELTGLPTGLPVVNGAHDQYCTAVGLGVTRPGAMQLSCGTAWVVLTTPETLEIGLRSGMAVSCHAAAGRWGALRSLGGVGASLEWLVNQIWGGISAAAEREQLYELVNQAAMRSAPGADGLLFFTLSGGHGETYGSSRGGFLGLTLSHSRDHLARAVLEGITYELRWALEEMRLAGVNVTELKMVGGGAKSPILPQIVADVTGIPVSLPPVTQAASWGAAVLAGVGVGVFPSFEAAAEAARGAQILTPNARNQTLYDERYAEFRRLHPAASSLEVPANA